MNTANKNGILFGLLCPGELRAEENPIMAVDDTTNDTQSGDAASEPIPVYK